MIVESQGSLFDSGARWLVNPVNCIGVAGAGLAKTFRDLYPASCKPYRQACANGSLLLGRCWIWKEIVFFPTKKHWLDKSQLEWIDQGLIDLCHVTLTYKIETIAIPALGCGLGGLDYKDVLALLKKYESQLPSLTMCFPPQ